MNNNNKIVDTCRLLENYNVENIYLYACAKYDIARIFYSPNFYYLPKWARLQSISQKIWKNLRNGCCAVDLFVLYLSRGESLLW